MLNLNKEDVDIDKKLINDFVKESDYQLESVYETNKAIKETSHPVLIRYINYLQYKLKEKA